MKGIKVIFLMISIFLILECGQSNAVGSNILPSLEYGHVTMDSEWKNRLSEDRQLKNNKIMQTRAINISQKKMMFKLILYILGLYTSIVWTSKNIARI